MNEPTNDPEPTPPTGSPEPTDPLDYMTRALGRPLTPLEQATFDRTRNAPCFQPEAIRQMLEAKKLADAEEAKRAADAPPPPSEPGMVERVQTFAGGTVEIVTRHPKGEIRPEHVTMYPPPSAVAAILADIEDQRAGWKAAQVERMIGPNPQTVTLHERGALATYKDVLKTAINYGIDVACYYDEDFPAPKEN